VCLVNVASSLFDAVELRSFARLVILREVESDGSIVLRSDGPRVTDVNNVDIIVESHDDISAAARLAVLNALGGLELLERFVNVDLISLMATLEDGRSHVLGELGAHYYVVVQVLFQVLGALVASVAVVHREDLDLGPLFLCHLRLFQHRLDDVEDNGNSVFVGFANKADVGVGRERLNHSEFFTRRLRVGEHDELAACSNLQLLG